jgi:DNA-binding transcriptional regulator YiaG
VKGIKAVFRGIKTDKGFIPKKPAEKSGKPLSSEHCKKLSEAHKGKYPSAETHRKMSEARRRRASYSDETRRKISEAKRKLTDADIGKIREALAEGISGRKLAKKYGVGNSTICRVKYAVSS